MGSDKKLRQLISLWKNKLVDFLKLEKISFLIVGGINTLWGFTVFVVIDYFLSETNLFVQEPVLSATITLLIAHAISSTSAFFLYKKYVFRVRYDSFRQYLKFQAVYTVPLTINFFVLPVLVFFGMDAVLAQFMIVISNAFISFFGHKHYSFKRPK
jgi:putative flippase GtrA